MLYDVPTREKQAGHATYGNNNMVKHLILISLLLLLGTSCTQQAVPATPSPGATPSTPSLPSSTMEPPVTPPTLSLSQLAASEAVIPHPIYTEIATAMPGTTANASLCPGAPGPYAAIGKQVTVVEEEGDKLLLRSEPDPSAGTVIGELSRFDQLQIVGGPVCVRGTGASYWYWQVEVLTG